MLKNGINFFIDLNFRLKLKKTLTYIVEVILKYKISNYLPFNSSNNRSNEFKSEIKTSLAFAPLKPPTTPAASN